MPETVPDEKALFLSDVVVTSYWATECANIHEGDTVCIFGAGPIGLFTGISAKQRGAARVLIVDNVPERLQKAESLGMEPINYSNHGKVTKRSWSWCQVQLLRMS